MALRRPTTIVRFLIAAWVIALPVPAAAQAATPLPSLFVVGDSTANNTANGGLGWGDPFAAYFDSSKVTVVNRARAGRSSRTFITEGLWANVVKELKAGDIVLIQFGHNDPGAINDDSRARGSLPGLGDETQEIDNLLTKQHEVIHTFGWYMRTMIAEAKAKGATPVVLGLTVRNIWKDGKVERGPGQYSQWSSEIARSEQIAFVDLTTLIANKYEVLGEEQVKPLFGPDHTHTSPAGAEINASLVVSGLKALAGCPVCPSLSAKGAAIPAALTQTPRRPLPEPSNPKLPTLFLIGDSTVRNGQGDGADGQWGWGEPLVAFFDTTKINVVNRAVGGLSSRTYLTGGHWDKVLQMLKPGDFVMMQFGHNDNGALNDDSRARGTITGIGEETREIDNLLTKTHEVVHSYGWYLRKFVTDARAKGATPIVCSLIPRKIWENGRIARNAADYAGWAAAIATAEHAAFIDLNEIIAAQYDRLGPEKVEPLFADPHTHTSLAGAELNAASVIAGLERLQKNPLKPYLSGKATGHFRFDFRAGPPAAGFASVSPATPYAAARGYGFEAPAVFSVAVPEGNYKVTVTLGDRTTAGDTTIYAELRRLMVESVQTRPGQTVTRAFIVNVRQPVIAGTSGVALKDREKTTETRAWDDRLTITFAGPHPAVATVDIERATVPTVYLLGDSTMCDQPLEPFNSWGQMLTRFLKPELGVANHAESGESLAGALSARRVAKILSEIQKGDYLFVQFGHNDMKSTAPDALQTYTSDMRRLVDDARARGAVPVLVTSVSRRTFDPAGRTITDSFKGYTQAVRAIAKDEAVALIDLQASSAAFYEALGPEASHLAFATPEEATHHNDYGSYEIVKCVLQGIRGAKLELARYIVSDFTGFDPRKPDPIGGVLRR